MGFQSVNFRAMVGLRTFTAAISLATIGLGWAATPSKAQVSIVIQTQTPSVYRTSTYRHTSHGYRSPGITYHNHYNRPNPHIYTGAPRAIVQPVQVIAPIANPYANPYLVNPVIVGSPVVNSTLINPTLINSPVQSSTVIVTPGYQSIPTYRVVPGTVIYPQTTRRTSISISF